MYYTIPHICQHRLLAKLISGFLKSDCQGLSFLAASLLLHMPEEQAFCVLVRVMFRYGLRDLFKVEFIFLLSPDKEDPNASLCACVPFSCIYEMKISEHLAVK